MLSAATRALCVVLSLQSLATVASSRAVLSTTANWSDRISEVDSIIPRTGLDGTLEPFWLDKKRLTEDDLSTVAHSNTVRAVPVIKPAPKEPAPDEPDPLGPTTNDPHDNPDNNSGELVANDEDSSVKAAICGSSLNLLRRSACFTGDDTIGLGENPAGDDPTIDVSTEAPQAPGTDLFGRLRNNPDPPVDAAKAALQARIAADTPDEPLPDPASFDANYVLKPAPLQNVLLSGGRQRLPDLLSQANIDVNTEGNFIEIKSLVQSGYQFHESTWTNDGKLAIADWSDKFFDHTPDADRFPWFKVMMHIASTKIPNVNDPTALQAIAQVNIVNKDTLATIDSIFEVMNPTNGNDMLVLSADAQAGSDEAAAFDAFMSTDNGRGQNWLLANYFTAMGSKTVRQLLLRKRVTGTSGGRQTLDPATALMVLG